MQDYNFAPVGPFAVKERAKRTANKYGGKVIEQNNNGVYYIVPLNMDHNFEVMV